LACHEVDARWKGRVVSSKRSPTVPVLGNLNKFPKDKAYLKHAYYGLSHAKPLTLEKTDRMGANLWRDLLGRLFLVIFVHALSNPIAQIST
jgi:hypothetical protein